MAVLCYEDDEDDARRRVYRGGLCTEQAVELSRPNSILAISLWRLAQRLSSSSAGAAGT